MVRLLWTECLHTPPPKFKCWNPTPQCDGIGEWGLWEVIRIRWGHEGRALKIGISSLVRIMRKFASSLLSITWGHRKSAAYKPEDGPHQNPTMLALHLRLPASTTVKNKSMLYFFYSSLNGLKQRCENRSTDYYNFEGIVTGNDVLRCLQTHHVIWIHLWCW